MLNNETKCYNCQLDPNTCYCKCKLEEADWEYVNQLASDDLRKKQSSSLKRKMCTLGTVHICMMMIHFHYTNSLQGEVILSFIF